MSKFKVGDKVRIKQIESGYNTGTVLFVDDMLRYCGLETTIRQINGYGILLDCDGGKWNWVKEWLELVDNKNKNMSLKEKFASVFLKEPEKSFRKAGVTDSDGVLTSEGQNVFLSFLLKKNGDAFKSEIIDPILAEEKE